MATDFQPVLSCQRIRQCDRIAIERLGIAGIVLMENAGRNAAEAVLDRLRPVEGAAGVLIVAGTGNNGGDGFVVARHLDRAGVPCEVLVCGPRDKIRGDALANLAIIEAMGLSVRYHGGQSPCDWARQIAGAAESAGLIVDAMLGTGQAGPPRQPYAAAIEAVNRSGRPVVALDIPSGLDGDTGQPAEPTVRADWTVTFAALKQGFSEPGAADYTGRVILADIGIAIGRLL